MTEKDGERIVRLEAQQEHIVKKLDEMNASQKAMAEQLTKINNTFEQAKGAKYVIVGAAAIGGFISAKIGAFLPHIVGKSP